MITENEENQIRIFLWLNHGCSLSTLYGDDGEIQCSHHLPPIDFKRDNIADILNRLNKEKFRKGLEEIRYLNGE